MAIEFIQSTLGGQDVLRNYPGVVYEKDLAPLGFEMVNGVLTHPDYDKFLSLNPELAAFIRDQNNPNYYGYNPPPSNEPTRAITNQLLPLIGLGNERALANFQNVGTMSEEASRLFYQNVPNTSKTAYQLGAGYNPVDGVDYMEEAEKRAKDLGISIGELFKRRGVPIPNAKTSDGQWVYDPALSPHPLDPTLSPDLYRQDQFLRILQKAMPVNGQSGQLSTLPIAQNIGGGDSMAAPELKLTLDEYGRPTAGSIGGKSTYSNIPSLNMNQLNLGAASQSAASGGMSAEQLLGELRAGELGGDPMSGIQQVLDIVSPLYRQAQDLIPGGLSSIQQAQDKVRQELLSGVYENVDREVERNIADLKIDFMERGLGGAGRLSSIEANALAGARAAGTTTKAQVGAQAELERLAQLEQTEQKRLEQKLGLAESQINTFSQLLGQGALAESSQQTDVFKSLLGYQSDVEGRELSYQLALMDALVKESLAGQEIASREKISANELQQAMQLAYLENTYRNNRDYAQRQLDERRLAAAEKEAAWNRSAGKWASDIFAGLASSFTGGFGRTLGERTGSAI